MSRASHFDDTPEPGQHSGLRSSSGFEDKDLSQGRRRDLDGDRKRRRGFPDARGSFDRFQWEFGSQLAELEDRCFFVVDATGFRWARRRPGPTETFWVTNTEGCIGWGSSPISGAGAGKTAAERGDAAAGAVPRQSIPQDQHGLPLKLSAFIWTSASSLTASMPIARMPGAVSPMRSNTRNCMRGDERRKTTNVYIG